MLQVLRVHVKKGNFVNTMCVQYTYEVVWTEHVICYFHCSRHTSWQQYKLPFLCVCTTKNKCCIAKINASVEYKHSRTISLTFNYQAEKPTVLVYVCSFSSGHGREGKRSRPIPMMAYSILCCSHLATNSPLAKLHFLWSIRWFCTILAV